MKILFFSDIHIGAESIDNTQVTLDTIFKTIKQVAPDVTVFSGDTFDRKLSLSSKYSAMFHAFLNRLKKHKIDLIMMKGTPSHDADQLENFEHDAITISTAIASKMNGLDILWIPEEYPADKAAFYDDLLNTQYDLIIGHGMSDLVNFFKDKVNDEIVTDDMVWNSKLLSKLSKTVVIFGHVHQHMQRGKFMYVGSWSRWAHDDDGNPKMAVVLDIEPAGVHTVSFVENKNAPKFKTITVDSIDSTTLERVTQLKKKYASVRIKVKRKSASLDEMTEIISRCDNVKIVYPPAERKIPSEGNAVTPTEIVRMQPFERLLLWLKNTDIKMSQTELEQILNIGKEG